MPFRGEHSGFSCTHVLDWRILNRAGFLRPSRSSFSPRPSRPWHSGSNWRSTQASLQRCGRACAARLPAPCAALRPLRRRRSVPDASFCRALYHPRVCTPPRCRADGQLTAVQVLAATAITGTLQALAGGQPLLIVGVAEPIVITYDFMYKFARDRESERGWGVRAGRGGQGRAFPSLGARHGAPRRAAPACPACTQRRPAGPGKSARRHRRGTLPALGGLGLRLDVGLPACPGRHQRGSVRFQVHSIRGRGVWPAHHGEGGGGGGWFPCMGVYLAVGALGGAACAEPMVCLAERP